MQTSSSVQSSAHAFYRIAAQARFFTASLLVHIVLVIFAGSYVVLHNEAPPPDFVSMDSAMVVDTPAEEPSGAGAQSPTPTLEPPPPSTANLPSMDALSTVSTTNTFKLSTASPGEIDLGKLQSPTGSAASVSKANGAGLGQNSLERMGGTSMVKFFGNAAKVQAVVFVVDISGSMISGTKSAKSYEDLEDEIKRVIRKLDSRTLFGLVAFSRDAHLYREQLVAATGDEKQRAINWLRKLNPVEMTQSEDEEVKQRHHGTRADKGLEAAFKLKPDTIFFVSDGEPSGTSPGEVLQMVTQWQKERDKPAAVNAVAYLADGGQKFMTDLATQNGGSFREINPERDRK